jgi:hypothetical protein
MNISRPAGFRAMMSDVDIRQHINIYIMYISIYIYIIYIHIYNIHIYIYIMATIKNENKTPRSQAQVAQEWLFRMSEMMFFSSHTWQIGTDKPWTPVLPWLSSERSAPGTHGTHGTPQVDDLLGMFVSQCLVDQSFWRTSNFIQFLHGSGYQEKWIDTLWLSNIATEKWSICRWFDGEDWLIQDSGPASITSRVISAKYLPSWKQKSSNCYAKIDAPQLLSKITSKYHMFGH